MVVRYYDYEDGKNHRDAKPEQRELESLPETIHKLEADVSAIHQAMADPSYFQRSGDEFVLDQKNLSETQARLTEAYTRWEELESLFPGGSD